MKRAWLLNFDADLELAVASASAGGYTPSRAVKLREATLQAAARGLVPSEDALIDDAGAVHAEGTEGRAFCPTPRALRAFRVARVACPPAPPFEVLRRVNHRRFSAELGATLPGATFVTSMADLTRVVQSETHDWLLKPAFSFAGRGQRRVRGGIIDPTARALADKAFAAGVGLQVEPLVDRVLDVALHGFLTRDGVLVLGEPTRQVVDERGSWRESTRLGASDLAGRERDELAVEAQRVGGALHAAGYFGPFGIDGFCWTARNGEARFNPRCDINARYTMGWATGMGDRRPDLEPSSTW